MTTNLLSRREGNLTFAIKQCLGGMTWEIELSTDSNNSDQDDIIRARVERLDAYMTSKYGRPEKPLKK